VLKCVYRSGSDVLYYKNRFVRRSPICQDDNENESDSGGAAYMTASFTIEFPHDNDVCYLAYHFPYTYSKLLVQYWMNKPEKRSPPKAFFFVENCLKLKLKLGKS
jgi:hypothetical protein